jgi:hypothetical protein
MYEKKLDLYSDNNPKDTIKNLGYKNEEKAKYTINAVKNYSKKYQFQVLIHGYHVVVFISDSVRQKLTRNR